MEVLLGEEDIEIGPGVEGIDQGDTHNQGGDHSERDR